MTCPLCGQRKARRECPALQQKICTICCGSKRLTEIACPSDCVYLASAREHPAAAVRREQERDVATLLPTIRHLTERQYQLFFLFQSAIARHTPDGFARLVDADVADAASALASTLETAAKGVIYEHAAQSVPGRALAVVLKALLDEIRTEGARVFDHEGAVTLRAIAQGAAEGETRAAGGATYLDLIRRLLAANPVAARPAAESSQPPVRSSLILP